MRPPVTRRQLLTLAGAVGTTAVAGCLDTSSPPTESPTPHGDSTPTPGAATTPHPTTSTEESDHETVTTTDTRTEPGALVVERVYPKQVERDYISYEYIRFRNPGDESVDLTGYTVHYEGGQTYEFDDLTLGAEDGLALISRSGDDVVLQTDPGVYLRFAGFGESTDTSVLDDDHGTVVVRDADGNVVDTHEYGR